MDVFLCKTVMLIDILYSIIINPHHSKLVYMYIIYMRTSVYVYIHTQIHSVYVFCSFIFHKSL